MRDDATDDSRQEITIRRFRPADQATVRALALAGLAERQDVYFQLMQA